MLVQAAGPGLVESRPGRLLGSMQIVKQAGKTMPTVANDVSL
jgi:hypothetical protein